MDNLMGPLVAKVIDALLALWIILYLERVIKKATNGNGAKAGQDIDNNQQNHLH